MTPVDPARNAERLSRRLLRWSFANLLVVALLGLLLRAVPFLRPLPFAYGNLLHGHSHFAFGGWVQPVLLALLLRNFPVLSAAVPMRHWAAVSVLLVGAAWGMLLTFPVQGYGTASIAFSSLSLAAGIYEAVLVWTALRREPPSPAQSFMKWGFIWMTISAIGPFATGPIAVFNGIDSPLFRDAVYFYLHFQYNGAFTFLVLALLLKTHVSRRAKSVFLLFNAAVVPAFALSVLWHSPGIALNIAGAAAGITQLAGFALLLLLLAPRLSRLLPVVSIAALGLKLVLQALSALPEIALMAAAQRNFVIAYLHLVLLGFISCFAFSRAGKSPRFRLGGFIFLTGFFFSEAILVLNAFGWYLPANAGVLLAVSALLPAGVLLMLAGMRLLSQKAGSTGVAHSIARMGERQHKPRSRSRGMVQAASGTV
ncbi:MAG: hypothetical protein EOO16_04160 [Chitinophagaceae bacterium]|nr:MAG: hypothetical protein EOO16_04160 [Chitinophagaceae bacterium]